MKETVLQNFIINKMTQEQYDEALKSGAVKDDELYLTDEVAMGGGVSVKDASENTKGIAKIATQEEALRGYNDETIMTPLKTNMVTESKVGKLYQIGYTGTLEGGVLTFEQSSDETPYDLTVGYEYLVDLLFEAVGEIDDSIKVVIKNKGNIINLVNVLHDDTVNSITVGDLKQIMKYSTDIGWRWLFKAWYTETQAGAKVLVMPSTVVDALSESTDNTFTGVNTFKGDNHPVIIEGMAGTTATGLQIKDSLGVGETDVEHYRSGNMYVSRLLNRNKIADKDSYIDLYTTDVGVSVLDESMVDSVLVPTPDSDDNTKRAVNTEWANNNLIHKTGDEEIGGTKTFTGILSVKGQDFRLYPKDDGDELGEIQFHGNSIYPNRIFLDRYKNHIRLFGNDLDQTFPDCILTTHAISKNTNGYVKFGNGLLLQWGQANSGSTVTYPIAFTVRPRVFLEGDASSGASESSTTAAKNASATNFTIIGRSGWNHFWFAIGY